MPLKSDGSEPRSGVDAEIRIERSLVRDVDGSFHIDTPKTKKSRRKIAITSEDVELLTELKAAQAQWRLKAGEKWLGDDLVFTESSGLHLDPSNLRRAFNKAIKKLKLPQIRIHDLRHSHASYLMSQGVSPVTVRDRLGHSSVRTTLDVYGHLLPGDDQRIADLFCRHRTG